MESVKSFQETAAVLSSIMENSMEQLSGSPSIMTTIQDVFRFRGTRTEYTSMTEPSVKKWVESTTGKTISQINHK